MLSSLQIWKIPNRHSHMLHVHMFAVTSSKFTPLYLKQDLVTDCGNGHRALLFCLVYVSAVKLHYDRDRGMQIPHFFALTTITTFPFHVTACIVSFFLFSYSICILQLVLRPVWITFLAKKKMYTLFDNFSNKMASNQFKTAGLVGIWRIRIVVRVRGWELWTSNSVLIF